MTSEPGLFRSNVIVPLLPGLGLSGFIALLAGALGFAAHHRLQVPEQVVTSAAIIMLLPGLAVYRGLDQLISAGNANAGLEQLLNAVGTGLGLAAGVSVGGFLARRFVGLDRIGRRVLRGRQRTDRVE